MKIQMKKVFKNLFLLIRFYQGKQTVSPLVEGMQNSSCYMDGLQKFVSHTKNL